MLEFTLKATYGLNAIANLTEFLSEENSEATSAIN